ncbi:MAG: methyltransferase domain-containing protein [Planctomycetota bacterium]
MTASNKDAYLQPYREAQGQHGSAFDVTMWARPETQRLRFKVFAETINLRNKRLLDAGCSRGDLAEWLLEHGHDYAHYHGVDGLDDVVSFARTRGLERASFAAGDFVNQPELLAETQPDITLISGTLNTMDDDTALRVLEAAWAGCREALVFNFLSDTCGPHAVPQQYPAHRLPTRKLLDWALDKTPYVVLRQDYFRDGHDATIVMRTTLGDPTTATPA